MSALLVLTRAIADATLPMMNVRQLALLLYLHQRGETRFKDVAASLGVSVGALSRNADVLTAAGWLERRRQPGGDPRILHLALTEAGQTAARGFLADAA